MRKNLLILVFLLAIPGALTAQRIRLSAGATLTEPKDLAAAYGPSSSELGWTLGGDIQFGKMLFVAPGVYWQQLRFQLEDSENDVSDTISLNGIQVPVLVGLGFDLKVVGLAVYAGPTLTFLTKVGDNAYGLGKSDFKSTTFGGQIGATVDVLFLSVFGSYEVPFTDQFDTGSYGPGKLAVTRFGLGFRF